MAAATGWRIFSRRNAVPAGVERRLLLSYLGVFVATLAIFAIVAHAAFLVVFEREMQDRLHMMARSAESVIDPTAAGFAVDLNDETIRALSGRIEGIRWSDAAGRVVAGATVPSRPDAGGAQLPA